MSKRKLHFANAVVTGKAVYLRNPTRRDAEEFVALNRASVKFHRGLVSPPTTRAQFTAFLKRSGQTDSACLLICRVIDSRIVSSINLRQIILGRLRNDY